MGRATLTIDLGAIAANWRALDAATGGAVETGAVIKAGAYGLGTGRVARTLASAGARKFFVALAEEAAAVRAALGPGPEIYVFSGHMPGDADLIHDLDLIPMLNSLDQATEHFERIAGHPFAVQLDTGMNRLGMEPAEWAALRDVLAGEGPRLVASHLACADEPSHEMNQIQLDLFREMTADLDAPLSLSATGGILMGKAFHFDLTRPGIGLYGGAPYQDAAPVVRLSLPIIQTRTVAPGETVGYGNTWRAETSSRIATVNAGYADGLMRALTGKAQLFDGDVPCPAVGRVSMDMIGVDITHLKHAPAALDILCPAQGVDALAEAAGTIGYEVLTSLGARYDRHYQGVQP